MSFGLAGAHRTGKSTLARAFAERHAIPFVETRVSEVFDALGRLPKVDYAFSERLRIQQAVLEHLERTYATAPARFITDRTPIDLLAYTLADVRRENVSGELAEQMMAYVDACFAATNRYFSTLLVVQPGIRLKPSAASLHARKRTNHRPIARVDLAVAIFGNPERKTPRPFSHPAWTFGTATALLMFVFDRNGL